MATAIIAECHEWSAKRFPGSGRILGGSADRLKCPRNPWYVEGMRSRARPVGRVVSPVACAVVLATVTAFAAGGCGSFTSDADPSTGSGGDGGDVAEGGADAPGSEGSIGNEGGPNGGPRRLYVIGGEIAPSPATDPDAGTPLIDKVTFTTQLGDGSLVPWTETTPLFAVHGNGAVATAEAIVSLGGEKGGPFGASAIPYTSRAHVTASGALDTWNDTRPLPVPVYFHGTVAVNGRVYVMGGSHVGPGAAAVTDAQFAPLGADGVIGSWTGSAALPVGRTRLAAASDGTHVFVIGGRATSGCADDVLVGTIGVDGNIPVWTSTGQHVATEFPTAVVFANKLYVIGGFDCGGGTSAAVRIADIHADGTLSPFMLGVELPKGRAGVRAIVVGSYLYAIGGDGGSGPVSDVDVAKLGTNGDFDTWRMASPLPVARSLFGLAAY